MPVTQNKYLPYAALALLSIPLFFLNIHDFHPWGDDFAQYIKEAQNIAHGKPFYLSNYIYNKYNTEYAPPEYPPGYPLLLAPFVSIWGIAIKPLLYLNTIITTGLLFALFGYFRKHTGRVTAICLAVVITYSGMMIDLKGNVLSDIPCLLFIVLYLTARNATSFSLWRVALLIFLAVMAVLIRSQAILLLAAEAIYCFISILKDAFKNKRFPKDRLYRSPSLYIICISGMILFVLNNTIFYAPLGAGSFYGQFVSEIIHCDLQKIIDMQVKRLLQDIGSFIYYDDNSGISFVQSVAITFCMMGLIISVAKRTAVDDIFFILMCLLIIFLPVHDPRYFLPAIPVLFFYCYTTFKVILPAITKANGLWVGIPITLLYLNMGSGNLKNAALKVPVTGGAQQADFASFRYISQHVAASDIIIFAKPRLLTLYTNKKSINVAWQVSKQENKRIFDSMKVKYFLVFDGMENAYAIDYLRNIQHPVDSVKLANCYLYSLR